MNIYPPQNILNTCCSSFDLVKGAILCTIIYYPYSIALADETVDYQNQTLRSINPGATTPSNPIQPGVIQNGQVYGPWGAQGTWGGQKNGALSRGQLKDSLRRQNQPTQNYFNNSLAGRNRNNGNGQLIIFPIFVPVPAP